MKKLALILILSFTSLCVFGQDKNPVALTQGLNNFAFNLGKQLTLNNNQNLIFSPYSISSLLTIVSQGAANATWKQLSIALNLPEKQDNTFSELDQINYALQMNGSCSGIRCFFQKILYFLHLASPEGMLLGNAIWVQKDISLDLNFLKNVKQISSVNFYQLDFKNNPELARKKINSWVEKKTNRLIQNLFTQGTIDVSTRMVLTNAIYFKGFWEHAFEKNETRPAPFTTIDSHTINVQMMQQTETFSYFENENMQLAILPYKNSPLAMAILLPKKNYNIQNILQTMNTHQFDKSIDQSSPRKLELYLPKFKFSSLFHSLKDNLQLLGIKDAFTDHADFSRLSSTFLAISDVIQKVVIDVDEKGTTAAVVTGTMFFAGAAMPSLPLIFKADHPFIFIIFEKNTHTILFIGQVTNPLLMV